MPTLQSSGFQLRALPRVPQLNPADFNAGIGNVMSLVERGMQLPARLEQVRATQRQGRLERATEPQRLELAQAQAAAELESLPYRTAAQKEAAMRTESGGSFLSYDESGNLVRHKLTVRTNPVTGEVESLAVPEGLKMADDIAAERENARLTADYRRALAQAAISNAASRGTAADAAMLNAETRASGGGKGRGVTRDIPGPRGRAVGVGSYEYDGTGRLRRLVITPAAVRDPVTGKMIQDLPYEVPLPGGDETADEAPVVAPAGRTLDFTITDADVAAAGQQQPPSPPGTSPAVAVPGPVQAGSPATPVPVAPQAPVASTSTPQPNAAQLQMLRSNPALAPQFDEMFGPGAAARILGGR